MSYDPVTIAQYEFSWWKKPLRLVASEHSSKERTWRVERLTPTGYVKVPEHRISNRLAKYAVAWFNGLLQGAA